MNRRVKLTVAAFIFFCFSPIGLAVMEKDEFSPSVDELLNKIAAYKEGQSRENLVKLENIIRRSHGSPQLLERLQNQFLKFLDSDATADGKNFICRQLSIIGTEEAVPVLSVMLAEPKVSEMVLYALERIPGEAVDDALCAALDKASGQMKVGIINSLGQRASKKAIAPLGKLLSSSDEQIANSAAAALGKIADPAAADKLSNALKQASSNRRIVLADACLSSAYNLAASGNKQASATIYKQLYDSAEPSYIRSAALMGIVDTAPVDATEYVVEAVKSGDPAMQAAAIGLVRKIPDVQAVASEMPNLPPEAQVQLLSALAGSKDIIALPVIVDAVKSENRSVRIAALKALATAGDASTVLLLAQTGADANGIERQTARESLYRLNAPGVNEKIIEQIPLVSPSIKVELIKTLGERNIVAAIPTLLESAKDPDEDVRIESLKVLRELAGVKHLKALVEDLTNAKSEKELKEAEKAVSAVARRAEGGSASAMIVQDAFINTEDPNVCCALLRVLGDIGDRRSLGGLRVALREKNQKIHTEAVRSLSNWPNAAPADDLLKVAINSEHQVCRVLALRGYVRMAGLDDGRPVKDKLSMFAHAMDIASGPDDKKMILSALAKVPSPESLQMAVGCLDKEGIKQEAVAAVIKIAEATATINPERTKTALEKALASTDSDTAKQQIQQLLDGIK